MDVLWFLGECVVVVVAEGKLSCDLCHFVGMDEGQTHAFYRRFRAAHPLSLVSVSAQIKKGSPPRVQVVSLHQLHLTLTSIILDREQHRLQADKAIQ